MFESPTRAAVEFVHAYGHLAVFVFLFLETSMLFPFAPSEVVLPAGAALLAGDPAGFALFVAAATAGGTLGSLANYWAFRRYGRRAIERYGGAINLSQTDLDRGERWFRRWGQHSVAWGRLLPVVRSVISAPAGLAGMDARRFAAYSAVGLAAFAALLAGLVRLGVRYAPVDAVVSALPVSGPVVLAALLAAGALLAVLGWRYREHIGAAYRRRLLDRGRDRRRD